MQRMKLLTTMAAAAFAIAAVSATPALADHHELATLDGKPNLNGIWQAVNTANWNVEPHSAGPNPVADRQVGATGAIPAGLGVVNGGTIPYTEDAKVLLALHQENLISWDPEGACYLPGIPRATYMDMPFQIIQGGNDDILVAYEYASANRVIEMEEVGIPPIDTWMGTSYGSWDGDTLVVVTLAQSPGSVKLPKGEMMDGVTWLDRAGNYLTAGATVTERFTLKGENHIDYEVTIDDPSIYTEAWTMKMPLYRRVEENAQLLEFKCVPFSEQMLYGDLLEE